MNTTWLCSTGVCPNVRESKLLQKRGLGDRTPILMLTARDTPADRVAGLNEGADDYLVKPFDFAELVSCVQALQRRPPLAIGPVLACGTLSFDPALERNDRCGEPWP